MVHIFVMLEVLYTAAASLTGSVLHFVKHEIPEWKETKNLLFQINILQYNLHPIV